MRWFLPAGRATLCLPQLLRKVSERDTYSPMGPSRPLPLCLTSLNPKCSTGPQPPVCNLLLYPHQLHHEFEPVFGLPIRSPNSERSIGSKADVANRRQTGLRYLGAEGTMRQAAERRN